MRLVAKRLVGSVLAVLTASTGAMAQSYYDDPVCRQFADAQTAPLRDQVNSQAIAGTLLGADAHPETMIGIHLNLLAAVRRDQQAAGNATPEEKAFFDELAQWLREETGYQWIQGTRPQTLAFGLTDSPAGLAAWIVEKFRAWSDCAGDVESSFTRDQLLANISLYWFTGAIGSSFWPYYARMHGPWPIPAGRTIDVPTGYAQLPREIIRPPRSLAARTYSDIRRWSVMPRGGHFAALEQPEALANEVREFFRPLRRR
jgi:microsomal epoxide hydrolase